MQKQEIVETTEVLETAPVEVEDILTAVGGTLGRANNVLFLIPSAIAGQKKLYQEVAAEPLRQAKACQKVISANTKLLINSTDAETMPSLAKVIREQVPKKIQFKEEADILGKAQLERIAELKLEAEDDKEQLALDFASELIAGLIK